MHCAPGNAKRFHFSHFSKLDHETYLIINDFALKTQKHTILGAIIVLKNIQICLQRVMDFISESQHSLSCFIGMQSKMTKYNSSMLLYSLVHLRLKMKRGTSTVKASRLKNGARSGQNLNCQSTRMWDGMPSYRCIHLHIYTLIL